MNEPLPLPPIAPELASRLARREELLAAVRTLLIEELRVDRPPETIDPDTPLFGSGLALDSVDAVELVVAIERALGVDVAKDRNHVAVLRTLNSVVDRIEELRRDA